MTHTYPQQDHFGRVLQDLRERVCLGLLGGVSWSEGNREQHLFLIVRIFAGCRYAGGSNGRWGTMSRLDSINMINGTIQKFVLWLLIWCVLFLTSTRHWLFLLSWETLCGSLKWVNAIVSISVEQPSWRCCSITRLKENTELKMRNWLLFLKQTYLTFQFWYEFVYTFFILDINTCDIQESSNVRG